MNKIIQGFEQLQSLNKEFGMDKESTEKILEELHHFRAMIPIFGRIGSEKNTLMNALIRGTKTSPEKNGIFVPTFPVEIYYSQEAFAELLGNETKKVNAYDFLNGKENTSDIESAKLSLCLPLLKKIPDISLIDIPEYSPDFGIVQKSIKDIISKSLASVLVFSTDNITLGTGEINLLKLFKLSDISLFILIVKTGSLPEDVITGKVDTLKASLDQYIQGMDVTFCTPENSQDQFSSLIDFLFKIQNNIKTLGQKKYSSILINQLELLQIYIKTRISTRSLSLLALDNRDVDISAKIDELIHSLKTEEPEEEPLPEELEEIKADVKKIIHPDESTFVQMLLNYQDISEKTKSAMRVDLSGLNNIINFDIPALLKKSGPENASALLSDFKAEFSKFKDFILYDELIGKNIVGFGGSTGSGKTSFLNSIMYSDILPINKEPFKSLATYILRGEKFKVQGVNIFDAKIDMEETLKSDRVIPEEETAELRRILNNIFFFTPNQDYEHIAFLDLPGYDREDINHLSNGTDKRQLNSSDFIIWFLRAEDDNISEEDIQYLGTLRKDIRKMFIVMGAKSRPYKDLMDLIAKIKETLDIHDITRVGVYAYDIDKPESYHSREIWRQLNRWNDVKYEDLGFARRFKVLFVRCREFYEMEINRENKRLNGLNKALTLSENNYVRDYLQTMSQDMEIKKNEMIRINDAMKELQNQFFKQIKIVSDFVGIAMPEPSEIDLIRDNIQNPMEILQECRKKYSIMRRNNYDNLLLELLADVKPVLNYCRGGSEYKSDLSNTLELNCNVNINKIKFNDVYLESEEYKKMTGSPEASNVREEEAMKNQLNSADNMRVYFKRLIGRKYPIPEHPLSLKDDYTKELYLKMLCVIMLYDNEPTEAQTMFVQRLISGVAVKEYVSDYIKKAMLADVDFAGEFVRLMNGNKLSHSFIVDSLILVSIEGPAKKKQLEFISELCEMLSIKKHVMEYLASLSVTILEQDSGKYQLTLEKLPSEVDNSMFFGYIKSFFTGCLVNTQDEIYYYSKEKKAFPFTQQNMTIYGVTKIRLENIIIDLTELSPYFESFETLELINCDFIGGKRSIRLGDGSSVTLRQCTFKGFRGFKVPLFVFGAMLKEIKIDRCDFDDCSADANWMEGLGSIFSFNGRLNNFQVQNSLFTKCVLKNVRNFHDSGAIGYIRADAVTMLNNTFTACRCDAGRLFYISSGKIQEENNRIIGCIPKLSYY